jgi:hypothetical protein
MGSWQVRFQSSRWARKRQPIFAPDLPNAPPELTTALGTLDQLVADHVARARVPAA